MSQDSDQSNGDLESVRIDKWLWAVRVFKTRGLAMDACKAGLVKVDERRLKPSYGVKLGDVYSIRHKGLTRTVKVIKFTTKRMGAKHVPDYMEELTPDEEYKRLREKGSPLFERAPGAGRPTKKDRRKMQHFRD